MKNAAGARTRRHDGKEGERERKRDRERKSEREKKADGRKGREYDAPIWVTRGKTYVAAAYEGYALRWM